MTTNYLDIIAFELRTLKDLGEVRVAQRILDNLLAAPGFLRPKRFGTEQPVQRKLDSKDVAPILDLWRGYRVPDGHYENGLVLMEFCRDGDYMVSWARGVDPRGLPAPFHSFSGGCPTDRLRARPSRLNEYLGLVERLVEACDPAFGVIQNGMTPHWDVPYDLALRLPDVPWGSIYGAPYIEMFGKERLLAAPFHCVKELPSGHVLATLSESVLCAELPEDKRREIRMWLGEECFMTGSRSPRRYKSGKVPEFDWASWPRPCEQ